MGPWPLSAAEVDLRLTTIGQGYQTRTASGEMLDRRRVTQWVDLRAFRLLGDDDLTWDSSFRITTELDLDKPLDGQTGNRAELMQARFSWRRLAGRFDLSLGRQMLLDGLDFLLFDGLRLDARLIPGLALRIIGGFSVRERSWLGGEVLELSGVEEGQVPAPVVGAGLSFGRRGIRAALDYRRIVLWEDGWPLDQELVGASLSGHLVKRRVGLQAGASYDLARDRWDRLRADGWIRALGLISRRLDDLKLTGGALRSRPRFAMDSIFNFFSPAPFDEVHGGLQWSPGRRLGLGLAYTHRAYRAASGGDGAGGAADGLDLDGRLLIDRSMFAALALGWESGSVGERWLVAPRWVIESSDGEIQFDGRGFITSFADPVQANQHALTVGCSASLRWRFGRRKALVLMSELNSNRFHPLQLRLFAVLDLAFQFARPGSGP